ncbi:unnamed protein product [Symbiodinium natans]|uniref:Uncharacterized protein n=1 Tax=Symbiodinium natans TaxID=878477 RepID=A0A812LT76_9DINO|nr:unnamed protein product [Symbiodinium natans]
MRVRRFVCGAVHQTLECLHRLNPEAASRWNQFRIAEVCDADSDIYAEVDVRAWPLICELLSLPSERLAGEALCRQIQLQMCTQGTTRPMKYQWLYQAADLLGRLRLQEQFDEVAAIEEREGTQMGIYATFNDKMLSIHERREVLYTVLKDAPQTLIRKVLCSLDEDIDENERKEDYELRMLQDLLIDLDQDIRRCGKAFFRLKRTWISSLDTKTGVIENEELTPAQFCDHIEDDPQYEILLRDATNRLIKLNRTFEAAKMLARPRAQESKAWNNIKESQVLYIRSLYEEEKEPEDHFGPMELGSLLLPGGEEAVLRVPSMQHIDGQDYVTNDALATLESELLNGPPVAVGVWWLWRCFNAHLDQHSRAALLALTYRHPGQRDRLVLVDMIALEQAKSEDEHYHKNVLGRILNAPHILKVVHFLERTALRALQLAFVTEDVRQGPTKPESYISVTPCVDVALAVSQGPRCTRLPMAIANVRGLDSELKPSSPAQRSSKSKLLAGVLRRRDAKEKARRVASQRLVPPPPRFTRDSVFEDTQPLLLVPGAQKSAPASGRARHAAVDQELEFLVQQIRSLCHDRKGIRQEMEQLDQRCRTEAVELRAQLSAAQARFAAMQLESDRLRRELQACPLDSGTAAAVQEMRFLETHVDGLRMGCGMVAEHLASMRAEVANYQSRVEQLYAEERRAGEEAGAAQGHRSATEAELCRVREAMLQSFQDTRELQQKFLVADQEFAAVKLAAEQKARDETKCLEEHLLSAKEEEASFEQRGEDTKARLAALRKDEAAALRELQMKDEQLNHLRELYETEREGSFLREEQFMQNQRRSLQDQSEELQRSGGLISVEMHERILSEQAEFYGKALRALDDLERSCLDRTQEAILTSFCSEPDMSSRDASALQKASLREDIAALACATATTEQDAELVEEQILSLSQELEASAAHIAKLKEDLLVQRSSRDTLCRSAGYGCITEASDSDAAELRELQAALSSQHQQIAELEAETIEAQDEERRMMQKLPTLQARLQESTAQAEAASGRLGALRCEVAEATARRMQRREQVISLQRSCRELVGTQRDALECLRSRALKSLAFEALCANLTDPPLPGAAGAQAAEWPHVQARGEELKLELQGGRAALRAATAALRALEVGAEAAEGRAGEVLEILHAALPPDLPDSVQGLKVHLQAAQKESTPSQISAVEAEVTACLQAARAAKEREAVQVAASSFAAPLQAQRRPRPELSALQGRSATAAAQVADLSARLYTLGRDMCDADIASSEQVLQAELHLSDLCRRFDEARSAKKKEAETALQLREALQAQNSAAAAAIEGATEEAKESLKRSVAEASTETKALSELLPCEIASLEEACAERVRTREAQLKAEASHWQSPKRRMLEDLKGRRQDLEAQARDASETWADQEKAQEELEQVLDSLAAARKDIQAIKEARGACEKAAEGHRDRLWDVEQAATDTKERRAAELRRAEMELQEQLRNNAERTQELEAKICGEEEQRQRAFQLGAQSLSAELGPALDEVLKVHAELEAETCRLLRRGKEQLFAQAGA